ncbi:RING finger protein 215 isoform X2 [Osmerus eperlanus]|uniref:RING finger protein 215 isoform X2 n=1 Tax=Osmerus eperlanus TaxID=29151 RepID=UPI002E12A00A
MAASFCWCYLYLLFLLSAPSFLSCLFVTGEQVASVEVVLRERRTVSTVLQGEVIEASWENTVPDEQKQTEHVLEGDLRLVQDDQQEESQEEEDEDDQSKEQEPWIGVVPIKVEKSQASTGNQESFAAAVVNKMKRALVLGASALIILALNQNTVREMDLSQVISKPIIVIQTSENVTKLIGALLRGLQATAKITYKTILQDNLKYLQQLWNTVILVALLLCTGVIVQARWQYHENQLNDESELLPKQDILKRLSSLQTRTYRQPKPWCEPDQAAESDLCAVCLEPFNNNQCLRVLPCLHEFHRDCVDPWLLLQHTCPLCKHSILSSLRRDS